jgi:hypothetical protein
MTRETAVQSGRFSDGAGYLVRPAVARTPAATRTPRAAVAVSGIAQAAWKPDAAACGPDAMPMTDLLTELLNVSAAQAGCLS